MVVASIFLIIGILLAIVVIIKWPSAFNLETIPTVPVKTPANILYSIFQLVTWIIGG
jgi:hypothetical protein